MCIKTMKKMAKQPPPNAWGKKVKVNKNTKKMLLQLNVLETDEVTVDCSLTQIVFFPEDSGQQMCKVKIE